ncbi:vanadium-dependent haloperoxidase [Crenothrix polyspora]|uniref:Phosphoesterase n=1 Tax=Crenothrix polyspora TaxID=360316 RepID=A0A1R4HE42_9GAMM|nr:vanadium-dependent haloperoxidase [Crenothrix polyspora]SJM94502.1 conserved exported hypothetical protein [Crenothrix polyspora]
MKNLKKLTTLSSAVIALLAVGYTNSAGATSVVTQWNDAALAAIRVSHPSPTVVSRALAITHTCIYDAWTAYDQNALSSRQNKQLLRPSNEHNTANKTMAISYAAHQCLTDLFPDQAESFDSLMLMLGYNPTDNSVDMASPAGVGNLAAYAVLNFRHQDGSNQLGNLQVGSYADYTGYNPVNTIAEIIDLNHWQPLFVNGKAQQFVTPHWGKVTPYALTSGSQFRKELRTPADYNKEPERYLSQATEILGYTAHLTDEKKAIAEYWADGPSSELPPGHWTIIASNCVSARDNYTLDQDVKLFFSMTNAVFDAGIAVWDAKRYFDYVRPVTAIRYLFAGQRVASWQGMVDGANWEPYQPANSVTPPFAEYISGHSAFSTAAAETLKLFTNSDLLNCYATVAAGSSKVEPGVVPAEDVFLYWGTFTDAANEAGISRRYGGIHFSDGDLESRKLGRLVAQQAWEKTQMLFNNDENSYRLRQDN